MRKNCFKTGRVNSFYCAAGGCTIGEAVSKVPLSGLCDGIPAAALEYSLCNGFLLSSKPQRGSGASFLMYNSTFQVAFLIWGNGFWTFYCFFCCHSHCAVLRHQKVTRETFKALSALKSTCVT